MIFYLIFFSLLITELPLWGKNYYYFYENRKIYFLSTDTSYKGRVHVDLGTNLTLQERTFCRDFDQGNLNLVNITAERNSANSGLNMDNMLFGNKSRTDIFSNPKQCGDGDPKVSLTGQPAAESVFERIALMCDQSQVPNCVKYAQNSMWAKRRWGDEEEIKPQIDEVFNQGMKSRIRDFLSLGGNLRATNTTIPCMLFRYERCGDTNSSPQSSKYRTSGEEWFMEYAVKCDAHEISPCIFYALYSKWAMQKWPRMDDRKKFLFAAIKKDRVRRVNELVKALNSFPKLSFPKLFVTPQVP